MAKSPVPQFSGFIITDVQPEEKKQLPLTKKKIILIIILLILSEAQIIWRNTYG